ALLWSKLLAIPGISGILGLDVLWASLRRADCKYQAPDSRRRSRAPKTRSYYAAQMQKPTCLSATGSLRRGTVTLAEPAAGHLSIVTTHSPCSKTQRGHLSMGTVPARCTGPIRGPHSLLPGAAPLPDS